MLISGSSPFPFITKEGSLDSFKTVETSEFNSTFAYGDIISGSYPYASTIVRNYYTTGEATNRRKALKNTFNYYNNLSPYYQYQSSLSDKEVEKMTLISIPSIFYGQSIRKGSLDLKFYITGTICARLQDSNKNGELVQTEGQGIGNVAGVVLYNEGFIYLNGDWSLNDSVYEGYHESSSYENPTWLGFMSDNIYNVSSSYSIDFEGTERIPTITMFAKAEKGELNHSNNTTYIEYGQEMANTTSSIGFIEPQNLKIKNIVNSSYEEEDPPFEKIVYISRIALYDENQNLIGIAKLSNPVRKKQNDNIAFKLKLDL